MKLTSRLAGFALLSLFAACSSSGSSRTTVALAGLASCDTQADAGVICGTVFAADGTTPVANATISMVTSSANVSALKGLVSDRSGRLTANSSACQTDDVGAFACAVDSCSGDTTFRISGALFSSALEFTATCTEGEVTNVPASSTTASSSQTAGVQWLVVPGAFDGIQLLLSELKGCTLTGDESDPASLRGSDDCEDAGLTVLDDADLATGLTGDLDDYQAIFVNCSADESGTASITSALQSYVNAGGNMYFSDLSDEWLTALFPDLITFPADKNATSSGTLANASVVDEGLQVFLGSVADPQETMSIEFDLGVWTAMQSVVDGWTTYIEGDISSMAPTLTGTRPITAGGPQEDGCVFYTSYHVEGASTGADQELALKYLILNRINNCD